MKDTFGLVPPAIKRMLEAEDYTDRQAKAGAAISRALEAIHPDLSLVFVRHDAAPEVLPPGTVPGRWHVRRSGPVPFYMPITTPDGGYREPDSGILQEVADRDMRRDEVARRVFGRPEREAAERARAKALYDEQKKDEMVSDLKAGWRVKGRIYRDDGTKVLRKKP